MAGCFEFRHKTMSFDFPATVAPSSGFSMFGKMLRSRSDSDVSPSKKHSEGSPKMSPKSSENTPKRRFVRVIRGSNQSDQYFNPHVKRKTSDPKLPKKRDLEALNRKYFSDSDSDSDTQIMKDRDFQRSKSEERSVSPSIPIHSGLKKNLSLDVEIGRRAHFRDKVDIIGIDKKGEKVYTAKGKIQFDNFETCDIKPECDSCPIVEPEGLDTISETPELAKSPPRLTLDNSQPSGAPEVNAVESVNVVKDFHLSKEPSPVPEEVGDEVSEEKKEEHMSVSDSEGDIKKTEESDSGIRPRTSSLDHYQKPLRLLGRLFRSTSDSIMKIGSPRGSPDQARRRHRYVRVLRDTDHGDEYHNPYVIRRSTSQEQSTMSGSVDNIHYINEHLRPILRKQNSLDLSTSPSSKHMGEVHAHFQETVEVVEFAKKTKCVNLIDELHIQESHLKSDDEENDSFDDPASDTVFHEDSCGVSNNMDPGVISDDSSDDVTKLKHSSNL